MAKMAVNRELLLWAIDDAHLDVETFAARADLELTRVQDWITGADFPSKTQLQKFAKTAGRSWMFFFLPKPPSDDSVPANFRASARQQASADSQHELIAVRGARSVQDMVRVWAETSGGVVDLPRAEDSPRDTAQALRTYLGWNVLEQTRSSSKAAMFRKLRTYVEATGIIVLLRSVGTENCRGFSLPDELAPLVLINRDYEHSSGRSFTLIHEVAHLMRGEEQLCEEPASDLERWCDAVAAQFLIPEQKLSDYVRTKTWPPISENDLDPVRLTANYFQVSWQVAVLRLKESGLADQSAVDAVFAGGWSEPNGFSRTGYGMDRRRFDEFGSTATQAISALSESRQIARLEALKRLRVTDEQYQELLDHAKGASA